MTGIPPLYAAGAAAAPRSRPASRGREGARFVVDSPDISAAQTASTAPTEAVGLQLGLLGLQHAAAEHVDERVRRRARGLLSGLAALQRAMLSDGDADPPTLAALRAQLDDLPDLEDPGLAAVVAAIVLRVEVELARRAMA